ncbi:MAG: hypothetical protein AB1498_10595 [bacterium]
MTRKEFLKNFVLFIGGLLFVKDASLFRKVFSPRKEDLKEAKFYKVFK